MKPFPTDGGGAAEMAARLLFVNPPEVDDDDSSPICGITIRIPATYLARLNVLAKHGGVSRNAMVQLILKAGFESVFALLPPEFAEELMEQVISEYESDL